MLPVAITYQQLQQLILSVYFCSRLRGSFSPCDQRFRFHHTLATLVSKCFQQPLHPVNRFHCFQETFEKLPPLSPFPGTATAGVVPWLHWATKTPTLQDLEPSRQNSCDHYVSQKKGWLHRNLRNFMKKGITNHCIYQFQSLSIAIPETRELGIIPKKERWKQRSACQPFTSHHSIPPHRGITTQKPHLAVNPVAFIAPDPQGAIKLASSAEGCSRRPVYTHQSLSEPEDYIWYFRRWWLRIVTEHLSHPVPDIFESQVSSLEITNLCLLNLVQARRIICATG